MDLLLFFSRFFASLSLQRIIYSLIETPSSAVKRFDAYGRDSPICSDTDCTVSGSFMCEAIYCAQRNTGSLAPSGSETLQAVWVMISYNLFYSFAYTIFNMSHNLMVPLSTRNTEQRGSLSVFNQIATIMISGILVALIFPMLIMPALGVDRGRWIAVMSVLSILALPLTLLEYYFTKKRVTLENSVDSQEKIPLKKQLHAVFGDKYMLLIAAHPTAARPKKKPLRLQALRTAALCS